MLEPKLYVLRLKELVNADNDISPKEAYIKLSNEGLTMGYDSVRKWLKKHRIPSTEDYTIAPYELDKSIKQAYKTKEEEYRHKLELEELRQLRLEVTKYRKSDYLLEKINKLVSQSSKRFNQSRIKISQEPYRNVTGKLLEIPIVDLHFAKLGSVDNKGAYDHTVATRRFLTVVTDTIERVKMQNLDVAEVVFPVGSDFFNYDTIYGTTSRGTRQDYDLRWTEMFDKGIEILIQAIKLLNNEFYNIPIHVLYVPGNHDFATSYYCTKVLEAYFKDNRSICFNISPSTRKYVEFGSCLIGFTHGDRERTRLFGNMQVEQSEAWGRTKFREWHCGHFHTEQVKENLGIKVRNLSSVSGKDDWHSQEGYVGAIATSQVFIWDRVRGLEQVLYINCMN